MRLYNTLTRKVEEFKPLQDDTVRIYSCGPTVYDHAHIGNLSAYIFADTLRRVLKVAGYDVKHVMNYTDVDDKTIKKSREKYPDDEPREALQKLTDQYIKTFRDDMQKIGNSTDDLQFLRATDSIDEMKSLITDLFNGNFAYIADDGVYFSIEAYKNAGHKYGQLSPIDANNTSAARISNDEYDKEEVHDFALWKSGKEGEPAWDFELDGVNMRGRPGWHIECSVMSRKSLGQPFDIHTGGVDLIFPHHENEIAQSTALEQAADARMAQFFCHNEHILVDGRKMAKSEGNFYTLEDIIKKGYDPLAFRLLVLQSHYRSQTNFSWEGLEAAQNRLNSLRAWADMKHQPTIEDMPQELDDLWGETLNGIRKQIANDLNIPEALPFISKQVNWMFDRPIPKQNGKNTGSALAFLDDILGLNLDNRPDIDDQQKQLITEREKAREAKDFAKSDQLRDQLQEQSIGLRDTPNGPIWYRL